MTDITTTNLATSVLQENGKAAWHRSRPSTVRPRPLFPPNEDIELWLRYNAPLSFQQLADIRYVLYYRCSRSNFLIDLLGEQFDLTGRYSTLRVVNDGARHYLLWKLRLLGRKEKWIGAFPRARKAPK